jgi:Tol biopolymer transport system component
VLLWLTSHPGPLLAQGQAAISVEWIYSDAGKEPTRLPPFAWTSEGDVLLLDTRKPAEARTFERMTAAGGRKPALDRKAARESLKALLGESGAPDSLAWPDSLDRAGRRAAYTFADDLFLLELAASRYERLTRTAEPESTPRLSPDGRRLAFVRGNDLFVLDLLSRAESRLTRDGSDSVRSGALSWVYWEEIFDHEDAGFWWSPDGNAIAFLRSDESAVSSVSFADFKPVVPRVITQRYPKAGGANPAVRLGVVEVESGTTVWMDTEAAPYEYVVAVEWAPDSRRVAVQTENRLQTRLDLYFVDRASGKPTRVLTETDAGWVNTHDLAFLDGAKGFLWSSERDGYTHLYRYGADGTLQNAVTKGPWSVRGPGGFTMAPVGAIAAVDDARGLVYFTALEKSPVERQLYRVHLDGSGQERLSREDGVHQVSFSPDHLHYLDVHSSHATLPSLSLWGKGRETSDPGLTLVFDDLKVNYFTPFWWPERKNNLLFPLADLRAFGDRALASTVNYTDAVLREKREEITDFFNANRARFNFAEEAYRIAQIVVTPVRDPQLANRTGDDATTPQAAAAKAGTLMERLKAGASFSELAMDYSEDPDSAPRGGDLGLVPLSSLKQAPASLRDAVLKTAPGMANLVSAGGAHTIVMVVAHEPAGQRDLSMPAVREGITETLRTRREQLLRTAYLTAVRTDAQVVNYLARRLIESQGKMPSLQLAAPGGK